LPSEKTLAKKREIVDSLSEKLKSSCAGVLVDYKGINVEDDTKLRKALRESGVEYLVTKNTLIKRAVENVGLEDLTSVLKGTTALAISKDDYVAASKILCEFAKDHDFFKVKSGYIDGKVIAKEEVLRLSKLPSREVLVSQVLRGLNGPITGLATALSGIMKGLVVALNAIAEKKEKENA